MRRLSRSLGVAAFGVILFVSPAARAEPIHWGYGWGLNPPYIHSDMPSQGKITLGADSVIDLFGKTTVTNSVALVISEVTNPYPNHPATFTDRPYALTAVVVDYGSNQSGFLTFTGKLDGVATSQFAMLTNTFTSPDTQSVQLGTHLYTVKVGSFGPLTSLFPQDMRWGRPGILATLTVADAPPSDVPEPTTLVLAGICLSLCGAGWWRRQRGRPGRITS